MADEDPRDKTIRELRETIARLDDLIGHMHRERAAEIARAKREASNVPEDVKSIMLARDNGWRAADFWFGVAERAKGEIARLKGENDG